MSSNFSNVAIIGTTVTAFVFVFSIIISNTPADAAEFNAANSPSAYNKTEAWAQPKLAELTPSKPLLTPRDRAATLESIQFALTRIADGSSYVWHRGHGNLSGIIRPTASFKDHLGQVCRHVVISLTSGHRERKTEAIACRMPSGIWKLDS